MITYDKSAFGLKLLIRIHGSAAYRAILPGILSVLVLLLIRYFRDGDGTLTAQSRDENDLQHPYAIGILVASTSFLIVFRANQGYARYWESCGALHQMMSKWMDATIHTGCYHMQCAHFDSIKPPSFFDYPELNAYFLTRDRERLYDMNNPKKDVVDDFDVSGALPVMYENSATADDQRRKNVADEVSGTKRKKSNERSSTSEINLPPGAEAVNPVIVDRAVLKSINPIPIDEQAFSEREERLKKKFSHETRDAPLEGGGPIPLTGPARLDGNWGKLFSDRRATFFQPKDTDPSSPNHLNNFPSFASVQGGRTPSLFLQELAHLCSLMNAVALSTLRNDIETAPSPLGVYRPGAPWPEVDPDDVDSIFLHGPWYVQWWQHFKFFIGVPLGDERRTLYNAGRPLEVLGGVSDAEIRFLRMARGPLAKTQLCWYWLTEFIIREHLNGSTGKVGPPIISRIIQFLSDGMVFYNHARKIMFIPFPFPHAQLSVIFIIISIPAVAFLMDQYADSIILGSILTFVSVTCITGIHEVARELENPFRNIPNELPICTLQAQFNEGLIVMFSGYHPDHFWDPTKHDHHPSESAPRMMRKYSRHTKSPRTSVASGAPPRANSAGSTGANTTASADAAIPTAQSPARSSYSSGSGLKRTSSAPASAVDKKQTAEVLAMSAKMEEYGKEIERLKMLLEKQGEQKAD